MIKFIKKLILSIFILILFIFILEYLLSLYLPQIKTYPLEENSFGKYPSVYSDYLPFTLPKNMIFNHSREEFNVTYVTNSFGYLNKKMKTLEKYKKRILFLGDSFTLGWGNNYEQSFVGLIETNFNDLEIINAAYHAGYSPDSYYAFLINEGIKLKPDTIIVVIYSGNDVEDLKSTIWTKIDANNYPLSIDTTREYSDYKGNLIKSKWNYETPILGRSRLFIGFTNLIDKKIRQQKEVSYDKAYNKFKISVHGINNFSEINNIKLIFLIIPKKPKKCDEFCLNEHKKIKEFIINLNKTTIDMKDILKDEHYYEKDGHLNNYGNNIVFNSIKNINLLLN